MTTWKGFNTGTGAATTSWAYDPYLGYLAGKTYDGGVAGPTYTNSPGGRLLARVWARGITTTNGYNNAGELETVVYSDGVTPCVTNTYDRPGRLTQVDSGTNFTVSLTYNDAGQVLSESWTAGPLSGLSVTNGYDQYLRRTTLAGVSTSRFLNHSYAYDSASRLQSVTDNSGATAYSATYSYLANSPLISQIIYQQGATTRMTTAKQYDNLNRLTRIASTPSDGTAVSFDYSYNAAGQRIRNKLADGSYWRYEYDSLGQVTSGKRYWADGTPVAGQQFEYAHDDIGNRTGTKAGGDANGGGLRTATYGANSLNQYTNRTVPGAVDVMGVALTTLPVTVGGQPTYRKDEYFRAELAVNNTNNALWTNITVNASNQFSVSGYAYVPQTPEQFGYDADGNLTNDGRWSYTWDGENRLVKMEPSATVTPPAGSRRMLEFAYDSRGRRIRKLVTNLETSATTDQRFLYDGWNLIAILNPSRILTNSFLWGTDLSGSMQGAGGVGGLLAVTETSSGQVTNAHLAAFDGNGNVAVLVSANSGSISAQYEYGPFGELLRTTGPMAKANPFGFSRQYQDDESDLVYCGYRYYSASTGRWLSRDPIEELGGQNLCGMLNNDVMNHYDVLGMGKAKAIGYVVRRLGQRQLQNVAKVFTHKEAARLFRNAGRDLLVKSKDDALKVARIAIDKKNLLRHKGHPLRGGGRGLSHFQDDTAPGKHIFWSAVATMVGATTANELNAQGTGIEFSEVYTDLHPGPSIANGLTATYWAGEESVLSWLDWINPLELVAMAGDAGRWIDRELDKELVGFSITVIQCNEPLWTFGFDTGGKLISAGQWHSGVLEQQAIDGFAETIWLDVKKEVAK